jgi:hypothetical protein
MKKLCSFNSKIMVLALFLFIFFISVSPTLAATYYVDDDAKANATSCDATATCNSTIQTAINGAAAGDTIIVCPGTYTEDLVINANITLKSTEGYTNTTIQLVDGVGIDIQAGASGFKLGGAANQGFKILSDATTYDIQLANAPSNVEISYNIVNTTGTASMGISVGAAGATGLTVRNNIFSADSSDGSIWGPNVVNVTVSNNTISGGAYGVQFSGVTGTSTISNNTISSCTGSGAIVISNGAGTSGLTISSNTITGCANGIRFSEYCAQGTAADMTTVTVTQNILSTNTKAIRIGDGAHVLASNFVIYNNSISGSTTYGLQNEHATETVNATNNWWNSTSGPSIAANTYNTTLRGDVIIGLIIFVPWLNAAYPTGSSWAPVTNASGSSFSSIDSAVTTAGDVVTAKAGTYIEEIALDKANFTLKSASGAASTIIKSGVAAASATHVIKVLANNITIGALGYGFTIIGNSSGFGADISAEDYGNALKIYGNILRHATAGESQAIYIDGAVNGAEIKHNLFYGDDPWANNSVEGAAGSCIKLMGANGTSAITIQNNTAYYFKYAFLDLNDEGTEAYDGVLVINNTAHHNRPGAAEQLIRIGGGASTTTTIGSLYGGVNITNNNLHDAGYGIRIRVDIKESENIHINYNNIYNINTTYYGIKSEIADSKTADVINNWWGDASGPTNTTTNVYGEGANVSAYLNFTPWLLTTWPSAHDSSFVYMLGLNTSWNLVSMPRILTNSTIDNVAIDLDATNDIQTIYYYNGTTWLIWQADGADTLTTMEPRKGYWMKCGSKTAIGVKGSYKTSDQPPYTSLAYTPLDLTIGWHTVGFYNEDGSSGLDTDDALSTLCDGTCSVGVANFDVLAFYNVSTATTTRLLKSQYDGTNVWTQGRGFLIYMNTADTYR